MKRRPLVKTKYASKATHRITSPMRTYTAVDTEIPIPLPIAK